MRSGGRVDAGIGQKIDHHLAQARLVAQDQRRLGLEVLELVLTEARGGVEGGEIELPYVVGARGAGVGDGVQQDADQIDLVVLELAPGVEARQEQQVLDEPGHPHRLGVHPIQGVHGLLRQGGVTAFAGDELGVTADRGQRGAQLVGGVGHELAHLGLAALARRQSLIDVTEQCIER